MLAALLAALSALAVAACGGGTAVHSATVVTSIPGRTFVDLVPELPDDLDQTGTPTPASAAILPSWSGELVRPARARPGAGTVLPADGAVVPYLATSWSRDGAGDYIFRLRRHVRAPGGDPLRAADVAWSLERAIARVPEAPFLFELAHIDQAHPVTILGRHRVRINVTAPSPFVLSVLASADAAIYDSSLYRRHATGDDPWAVQWASAHPVSYGAYYVSSFLPNQEIVLTANPGFWRRPYYRHVLIRQIADPSTRLADVLDGTATHTSQITWAEFNEAAAVGPSDGARATILQDGPGVIAWQLNVSRGPLANPLVRQAINMGINRGELANALDNTNDSPQAQTIPAAFGQRQTVPFDPVQARSLMRAAGYPNGVNVTVYTNSSVAGGQVGTLLNFLYNQLIQIGVIMHTVYVDNTDQLLAIERRRAVPSTIGIITPLLGGAGFLLEQDENAALDPVSPAALEELHDPALQSALDQLRSSAPGPALRGLIAQAASIADQRLATIQLVTVPVQNVTRVGVTGYGAYTLPTIYYENLRVRR